MKKDIQIRSDIYLLVKKFYSKLLKDDLMRPIFEEFSDKELLEKHLQRLVNFWDSILFYSNAYQDNAMKPHIDIQSKHPFKKEHFDTWLHYFNTTVDEIFEGEMADIAKVKALSIATVMQIKVLDIN